MLSRASAEVEQIDAPPPLNPLGYEVAGGVCERARAGHREQRRLYWYKVEIAGLAGAQREREGVPPPGAVVEARPEPSDKPHQCRG